MNTQTKSNRQHIVVASFLRDIAYVLANPTTTARQKKKANVNLNTAIDCYIAIEEKRMKDLPILVPIASIPYTRGERPLKGINKSKNNENLESVKRNS